MTLEAEIRYTRPRSLSFLLVTLLALAGCSLFDGAERDSGEAAPERDSLRVGVGNAIETAPLRMAVAGGAFDRAGLHVRLVEQTSDDEAIAKLASGKLDIAFGSNVALFKAAAAGTSLQLQGEAYTAGHDSMALVTLPGSGYTEPMDLSAPVIGVDRLGDLGTLTTESVLRTAGIEPAEVTFEARPQPTLADALSNREVEAAWLVEPYLTQAQTELGATVLADCAKGATESFPMSSYATTSEFAKQNPRTLRLFRRLLGSAQQRGADPMSIRRALPEIADLDETTASLVSLGTYPTSPSGARLQRVADLMHGSGLLTQRLDVRSLLPEPRPS